VVPSLMKRLSSLALFILLTIVVSGLLISVKQNPARPEIQQPAPVMVKPLEAKALLADQNVYLLDVHTPEQTHIPGTDAFIPYDQVSSYIEKLPSDKDTPILVYCRSGNMSQIAIKKLLEMGYKKVYDLEGGTDAYREIGTEVVITPSAFDFGEVVYGEVKETKFILTNFSPTPLQITKVSTSCGCTKAEIDQDRIDSYGSAVITVSFDPAVHKDDTDLGELIRTIYIDTDNPNFPKLSSQISALVIKEENK